MPDEDTPRLVYADYLEEEGNAPRAEFIRVQCALARLPEGDPQRHALEDRQHELLAEHECAWLGVAPDAMDELEEWTFERGFVHEVAASPYFMRGPGADLCTSNLVRRWRVTSGVDNFPEDLKEAGQRGWFSRLEAVDLSAWYPPLGEMSGFFSRSNFGKLRELDVSNRPGLDALPDLLAFAPFRDQLKVLRCDGRYGERLDAAELIRALGPDCRLDELTASAAMLTDADLGDLLAARVCSQLTSLDVTRNGIMASGWNAFKSAPCRLRELDVSWTTLGSPALARLLGYPALRELRRLHLSSQSLENADELASSPFWAQAEDLRIQSGPAGPGGYGDEIPLDEFDDPDVPEPATGTAADPADVSLDTLFASAGSKHLRRLDIAGCALRDAGVAKLCAAAWAESLTYLDLSSNYLSDEALRTIAKSGRLKKLHTLHLNFNSPYHQAGAAATDAITDAGLRVLADCPDLANLRVLSLSGIRLTATGLDAVLNSPHWRLSGLQLSRCQLRPNVVDVLALSPRLSRLEVLDLSGNDELDTDDLTPLAESEYLSPQTELDIRGLDAGDGTVRTALRERLGRRLSE